MNLGAFSISLSVADLAASRAFYEMLGFEAISGDPDQNWLILKNRQHVIGLFQGMFERNTLTFNPGWDQDGRPLDSFDDIRDIQGRLKAAGVEFVVEAQGAAGPASFVILDPDGNPILVDQHL